MIKGIDFSAGNGVTVAEIQAQGFRFVCRYLTGLDGNPKDINAEELSAYLAADVPVVFVFETSGLEPNEAQGIADAKAAQAQLDKLAGAVHDDLKQANVFFAADSDAPGDVVGYLKGACSVLGKARVGEYGGLASVKAAFDAGVCSYGWQTLAWSNNQWDDRALIRQVHNGIQVGPCEADLDLAAFWGRTEILSETDDFGQFPSPKAAPVHPKPKPKPPVHKPQPKPKRKRHHLKNPAKQYPALIAGLVNIAVAFAARFGFHLNADQVVSAVSVATAFLAALTHTATQPKSEPPKGA